MVKKVMDGFKKLDEKYMAATLAATIWMMNLGVNSAYASDFSNIGVTGNGDWSGTTHTWPWQKFLSSLAQELTGPLPKVLGALGIVGAAIALFAGNGGAGTQKFIMLIFAISIALFAPTFISWLSEDSGGATIDSVFEGVDIVKDFIQ